MESEIWQEILKRLLMATHAESEASLASCLGISSQSIYNAKMKKQIPPGWIFEVAKTFGVSADWLFFGRGPMRHNDALQTQESLASAQSTAFEAVVPCARCLKLEERLEGVECERRDLSTENRKLWQENGELKERCATLAGWLEALAPDGAFRKARIIPSSDTHVGE